MKRILLASTLFVLAGHAVAQPQLLSSEMAPFGTRAEYRIIDSLDIMDTSIQGANATWDFSQLMPADSPNTVVLNIVNPAQTPHGTQFPSSNYAHREEPVVVYRYYSMSDTSMERVGSWSGSLITYTDPLTEYVFPMSLGVGHYDSWKHDGSLFFGNYSLECVGYGTLLLPAGAHTDVLMVRAIVEEISLVPIYIWYDSDNGLPLIEYVVGDGFQITPTGRYIHALTLPSAVLEPDSSLTFNNPVDDILHLVVPFDNSGLLTCEIRDVAGRLIWSGLYESTTGSSLRIDCSMLSSGLYLTTLSIAEKRFTFKLIKR